MMNPSAQLNILLSCAPLPTVITRMIIRFLGDRGSQNESSLFMGILGRWHPWATWNPNDPCFDWSLGRENGLGVTFKNKGQKFGVPGSFWVKYQMIPRR